MYGVGGSPPEWRTLSFHGADAYATYPPLALDELAVVGRAYRALNRPAFPDTPALTVAIKTPIVLFEVGLLVLIYAVVRRAAGVGSARWAVLACWLNPAMLMAGPVLGYLDTLFVLPLAGALVCAAGGMAATAGALFAAAVLTKPQAAVALPALALAVWNSGAADGRFARLARGAAGGLAGSVAILAPVVAAGAWWNMLNALESITRHDMLSGNAPNLWWIVGYLMRAWYSTADMGAWAAYTTPTRILAISRVVELGYPNPRAVGTVLAGAAMLWGMWVARGARGPALACATAAFMVHAYATLSAQVHENHLFAAVPLLVVAAAVHRRLRPLLWTLSAVFALNLNAFYGISEYMDGWAIPRTITVVDLTVWLSLVNCAALAWHAALLQQECSAAQQGATAPESLTGAASS
jgi:hypothetical protein